MYQIILDVFAYIRVLHDVLPFVSFLVRRGEVMFRLRFQLPAGSSRRFNLLGDSNVGKTNEFAFFQT